MQKILFSFIGNTDPYGKLHNEKLSEGAIIRLQRKFSFDRLIIFLTFNENDKKGLENKGLLQEVFKEEFSNTKISIIETEVHNPTSHAEIMTKITPLWEAMLDQNPNDEYFFNASSGTPQLKIFGQLFAQKHPLNIQVFTVADPTQKEEDQPEIEQLDFSFLDEHFLKYSLKNYLSRANFLLMSEIFKSLKQKSVLAEKKSFYAACQNLFEAYHLWDSFRFSDAEKVWNQIPPDFIQKHPILIDQKKYLGKLINAQKQDAPETLTELFFNMQRRSAQGQYIDIVARFWRLWEGILNEMGAKHKSDWEKEFAPFLENLRWEKAPISTKLKFLEKKEPDFFQKLKNKGYGEDLLDMPQGNKKSKLLKDKRNFSIVAHGMEGIEQKDAEKSLEIAEFLIRLELKNIKNPLDLQILQKWILSFY